MARGGLFFLPGPKQTLLINHYTISHRAGCGLSFALCSLALIFQRPLSSACCLLDSSLAAPSLLPSLLRNSHPNDPALWVVRNYS